MSGYLQNWTVLGEDSDRHQVELTPSTFYRYGYFEKIFAKQLLNEIDKRGIFTEVSAKYPELTYANFIRFIDNPDNTCVQINWFYEMITNVYGAYLHKYQQIR